ncbi:DUF6470 family protein [Metabacillus halosaccharovorans]|uniref:DUF6470 family protein n=1 Tax=Metabacillus halosaccharovorans TaxID=930124 RepID=UPI0034CD4890
MKITQIRLESTPAKIGHDTVQAKVEIQQPQADLSIQQPKGELSIETTPSKLTIDQTEAWEDMDLKHISKRIQEFAQKGYQDWLEGLARRSSQGEQLMKIEHGGNSIASQARENSQKPKKEFGLGFIPSAGSVKIQYEPSKVSINFKPNKPAIDAEINKPVVDYTPGKVNIDLIQRNDLKIDFETVDIKA